jgi:hypothetical protein
MSSRRMKTIRKYLSDCLVIVGNLIRHYYNKSIYLHMESGKEPAKKASEPPKPKVSFSSLFDSTIANP